MRYTTRASAHLASALLAAALLDPARAAGAGPNGGQVRVADGHPIELVVSERALTFFLSDHDGRPLASDDANGKAFVSAEGRTQALPLTPAAPNRLVGALPAPLAAGAKVVLTLKGHGHHIQARFEP